MFALMVKDNGGYNPFGYNVWNGFQQVNNDELQKVVVSAKFSTPSIGIKGFENNEKSIQAFLIWPYQSSSAEESTPTNSALPFSFKMLFSEHFKQKTSHMHKK